MSLNSLYAQSYLAIKALSDSDVSYFHSTHSVKSRHIVVFFTARPQQGQINCTEAEKELDIQVS